AVFQALQTQNQYGDQVTYRMNGDIAVNGFPSVHMHNMFSSNETAPSSVLAALNLGDHFGRIFENHYTTPGIKGVNLDFDANPEAMVEDKVMPTLPLSVMNVMQGMRGGQDMYVSGESAVDETSTPMDYVVSGAQVLTVQIK